MQFFKKKPAVSREQHLSLTPLRAAEAVVERNDSGGALVKLPLRALWPLQAPPGSFRSFELDEMGLVVWDACDGSTTLLGVIEKFAAHYRINLREAEVATLKFLDTLARKRLIGMSGEARQ